MVQLANGTFSLRSEEYGETFHPVVGPVAEAQALYVNQLNLRERVRHSREEFVVWDIGLGAAGNPLTFLNAVRDLPGNIRILSFDYTTEPLLFALKNPTLLPYLSGWEGVLAQLLAEKRVTVSLASGLALNWELFRGDFPALLRAGIRAPAPHAIFYDAFSPATNPAMWTLEVFTRLFRHLNVGRPCSIPTYSRSTMLRVTLLLAGFYVGRGHATGEKEETTIAANTLELLSEPLDRAWLMRAKRSRSAEPLTGSTYCQRPLSEETWERLRAHAQFS
jgi:tRNA U34 5-methylaminomethyl-2-thiouridine-forming methyltransferase MnmC